MLTSRPGGVRVGSWLPGTGWRRWKWWRSRPSGRGRGSRGVRQIHSCHLMFQGMRIPVSRSIAIALCFSLGCKADPFFEPIGDKAFYLSLNLRNGCLNFMVELDALRKPRSDFFMRLICGLQATSQLSSPFRCTGPTLLNIFTLPTLDQRLVMCCQLLYCGGL